MNNIIVKYGTVSALSIAIGIISGMSISHYTDRASGNVANNISKNSDIIKQMDLNGNLRVLDTSKAITLRDESGKTFLALYNEKITGGYSDLRYIVGDGYLVYNDQIMQYINNPNSVVGNVNTNKNESIKESNRETKEKNLSKKQTTAIESPNNFIPPKGGLDVIEQYGHIDFQQAMKEITEEHNVEEVEENGTANEDLTINTYNESQNAVDLTDLILSDEEIEVFESENKQEPVEEMFSIQETRKKERIVDELDFVDSNVTGTSRDRALERVLPNEEDRETFRKDLETAANENLRKDAIKRISNMIGDFTIDFKTEAEEESRVITVFTDPTCPFCKRLHADIDKMTMAGYTVRYLLIPKDGMNSPVVDEISYISCQPKDRALELVNRMYSGNNIDTSDKPSSCTNDILQRQLSLAQRIGGERTPVIIDDRGGFSEGYSSMESMISQLDESIK